MELLGRENMDRTDAGLPSWHDAAVQVSVLELISLLSSASADPNGLVAISKDSSPSDPQNDGTGRTIGIMNRRDCLWQIT